MNRRMMMSDDVLAGTRQVLKFCKLASPYLSVCSRHSAAEMMYQSVV